MKTLCGCFTAIYILFNTALALASEPAPLTKGSAEATVEIKGGKKFSVSIFAKKPNLSSYGAPVLWGAEQGRPDSVVTKLDARIDKRKVHIPFSAFADLANPTNISVDQSGNDVVLLINGGDGADAYTAELVFQQGRQLRKRRVSNGSFPDKAWEETRYSFNLQ